jgi:hypothetical protein
MLGPSLFSVCLPGSHIDLLSRWRSLGPWGHKRLLLMQLRMDKNYATLWLDISWDVPIGHITDHLNPFEMFFLQSLLWVNMVPFGCISGQAPNLATGIILGLILVHLALVQIGLHLLGPQSIGLLEFLREYIISHGVIHKLEMLYLGFGVEHPVRGIDFHLRLGVHIDFNFILQFVDDVVQHIECEFHYNFLNFRFRDR